MGRIRITGCCRDDRELIGQFLFIYDGDELGDFLDEDRRVARVSLNLNVHKANDITTVMEKMRAYLREHVEPGMSWDIAGEGRLFADMEELLVGGQVSSLLGSVLMIFLMMAWLWRSFWQSVLTMIPNLVPITMIFIFMGVAGIWLDMATVMVASVTAGIAVDDTIHLYPWIQGAHATPAVRPVNCIDAHLCPGGTRRNHHDA